MTDETKQFDFRDAYRLLSNMSVAINDAEIAISSLDNIFNLSTEPKETDITELRNTIKRIHSEVLRINNEAVELMNNKGLKDENGKNGENNV